METEDLINLPASSNSGNGSDNNDLNNSTSEPMETESIPSNSEVKDDKLNEEIEVINGDDEKEDSQTFLTSDKDKDLIDSTTTLQVTVEVTEGIAVDEKIKCFSPTEDVENGDLISQDKNQNPLANHKRAGSPISSPLKDGSPLSGVKRPRMTVDEQQPSVHIVYNSLPRDSKVKLEELLQKWSEWHTRHYSPSHDSNEALESGEKTYFPALHVGVDKPSAVSFWMDNQTRNPLSKEDFIPLDSSSVPLYDRGFSLGLTSADGLGNHGRGVDVVDASRCFNCGSYNHSMKECPKPRDNTAVNNARKHHKSRRNQNASSRNPTRYYQNTPRGKYDGLRPGVLDAETQQLLGLGELDPPPWLSRMREIGYPPGYLDPEDADQPSGIMIFGEEESKEEKEDGEILDDTDYHQPEAPRKMSVEFPGINAPIPENADEGRWAGGPSRSDVSYRNRSSRRYNHPPEAISKGNYHEQRWSLRDYRDDGPPGCEPGSYSQRYGGGYNDSSYPSYSPRSNISVPKSPSYERSATDRGRRSPLVHETLSSHGSPQRRFSENRDYENRDNDEQPRHSQRRDERP
ncbi:hypothetical protein LguiA_006208 [Lonicera macranthoides]